MLHSSSNIWAAAGLLLSCVGDTMITVTASALYLTPTMPVPFLPFVASISVSTKISLCIFGTIVLALMFIKQILKRKEIRVSKYTFKACLRFGQFTVWELDTDHWVTVPMAEAKSEPVRVAVVGSGVGAAATW